MDTEEQSEKEQNCNVKFPQADYLPRHSSDFRTVFEIMIDHLLLQN